MQKNIVGVLWVSLVFLSACSQEVSKNKLPIPSAAPVLKTDSHGSVVRIGPSPSCTATIVSTKAVLTAAHCIRVPGNFHLVFKGKKFVSVQRIMMGPGVEGDADDIGLLLFNEPIASSHDLIAIGSSISLNDDITMVGFGCNEPESKRGGGLKRAGQNRIYKISQYLEVLTPKNWTGRSLHGPSNRAGSCYGDSGGPMFKLFENELKIVGVDHAVIDEGSDWSSVYIDLTRKDKRDFLLRVDKQFNLGMRLN